MDGEKIILVYVFLDNNVACEELKICVIMAWTSCHDGTPVDGKLCQLQAKNPLISTVQISRATSDKQSFHCGTSRLV